MMKHSRFTTLRNNIKKLSQQRTKIVGVLSFLLATSAVQAQHQNHQPTTKTETADITVVDAAHAKKFAHLILQDQGGRMKPIHTFAAEFLRKVHHKNNYKKQHPEQVLLSMMYHPGYWQQVPFIYVNRNNEKLKTKLQAEGNYAAFIHFFDKDFNYLLMDDVKAANGKKPADQSQYDKDVLAVDERINICYMVFEGSILRLFPKANDANNTWYSSTQYHEFTTHDSIFVKAILPLYFNAISQSIAKNNWSIADSTLQHIDAYQKKFGAAVYPSQTKIDTDLQSV